jgi:hypothetical protein
MHSQMKSKMMSPEAGENDLSKNATGLQTENPLTAVGKP